MTPSATPIITCIVPVYNAAQHLPEALASLCGQTHTALEILCIDDGSSDDSPRILAEAAAKDPRIVVFTQENKGPSAARNVGLDHATGEFVLFCDADDWLEPHACERLLACLTRHKADMAQCGHGIFWNKNEHDDPIIRKRRPRHGNAYTVLPPEGCRPLGTADRPADFKPVWSLLYKRDLITAYNLRFPEAARCAEDWQFGFCYRLVAHTIAWTPEPLYHYQLRKASLVDFLLSDPNPYFESYVAVMQSVLAFAEQHGFLESHRADVAGFCDQLLSELGYVMSDPVAKHTFAAAFNDRFAVRSNLFCFEHKHRIHCVDMAEATRFSWFAYMRHALLRCVTLGEHQQAHKRARNILKWHRRGLSAFNVWQAARVTART